MSRRRRGRPVDGWLLIDKPEGVSSADVVAAARRALDARKAGHAGTLDPIATGLLAIAFGEATKTVAVAQEGLKTYRFTIRLGVETATDDSEGAPVAESPIRPDDREIEAALPAYEGDILQVPPAHSAVKVAGRRAYDLARAGAAPELAARPLHVARLALVGRPDADHAVLELVCGKGGYVRAIARDLGRDLGCGAHVSELRRLASGGFDIADAIAMAELERVRAGEAAAPLLPIEAGLAGLPEIRLAPAVAERVRRGQAVPVPPGAAPDGAEAWASAGGEAVALGRVLEARFRPSRVFVAPEEAG